MKVKIHPSRGIDDLRFGMKFKSAVEAAGRYGEVNWWPAEPAPPEMPDLPPAPPKAVVSGSHFEVVLQAEDQIHLTVLEVYRPRRPAEVTVDYEGLDVFQTPARDLAAQVSGLGREVVWKAEKEFMVPGETLMVSRETGQDVKMDPHDGRALYPAYVLVGPKNYYERARAWLFGEAQYTDEE